MICQCGEPTGSDAMNWCSGECMRRWTNAAALEREIEQEALLRRGRVLQHWAASDSGGRIAE